MAAKAGEVVAKLLYVVVVEDGAAEEEKEKETSSFGYMRSVLQSALQLMGCKARHAFKISRRVFEMKLLPECAEMPSLSNKVYPQTETACYVDSWSDREDAAHLFKEEDKNRSKPFETYKKRTSVVIGRKAFLDVVCKALSEYKYMGPNRRADLLLAFRLRERNESVTVLLCGTSGCGKSTLSALLGSRLLLLYQLTQFAI